MNSDTSTVSSQSSRLAGYQLRDPHRPAVVIRPTSADQLVAAVRTAGADRSRIAVQSTGHGRSRGITGETLILTERLDQVQVDPASRTARVGAGARWGAVIAAAAEYGLAPLSGSASTVGAIGYTLGGGFGLLSPRFGYAADHVRAVDLVTPDGRLRHVTAETEPELFWAVRGAGSRLGVVTAIEIDLFAVPQLVGGTVFYDLAAEPGLLRRWQQWCAEQPEQMLAAATILPFPDLPAVPEPMRGRLVAQLHMAWSDHSTASDTAVSGLQSLGRPLHHTVQALPYARSAEIFADPDSPAGYRGRGWLLDRLPEDALAGLPEQAAGSPAMSVISIRRLGRAMAARPSVPNSVGHRQAGWSLGILTLEGPGGDAGPTRAFHDQFLQPWQSNVIGRALNFTFDALSPDEVSEGFDADAVPRLRALQAGLDPNRMMIANHPL